jgi:hypothetical protein
MCKTLLAVLLMSCCCCYCCCLVVWQGVAEIVARRVAAAAASGGPNASVAARCVKIIDRKLVKQTVMTSVYGVTQVRHFLAALFYDDLLCPNPIPRGLTATGPGGGVSGKARGREGPEEWGMVTRLAGHHLLLLMHRCQTNCLLPPPGALLLLLLPLVPVLPPSVLPPSGTAAVSGFSRRVLICSCALL